MKHLVVLILAFVSHATAHALSQVKQYDFWAPYHAQTYLQLVDKNAPAQGSPSCQPMYDGMIKDGVLDVRYALGYFDETNGQEIVWNNVNWGYSPSLDIVIFEALRSTLTAPCSSRTLRMCGFSEQGNPNSGKIVFQKYSQIQGQRVLVRITLTQASASEYLEKNKGELADRQRFLTAQSEENFFGGLKSADIVLYNGHSRDGGGPDFLPPVLNAAKKTNYQGYYHVKKPGIKRTMASLAENPNKGIVVGFFSCYARRHFYDTFMKANPHQRVILSSDTIDYFDAFKGSLGYLENMLRGSCGTELNTSARQLDKIRQGFTGFNLN